MFEIAELLDYIEYNRIAKIIRYVGAPLKQRLKAERLLKGESLTAEQLLAWIEAIQQDMTEQFLTFKDYVLFMLTLNLGDRKSESYALQWQHIDFEKQTISLVQALDKESNITLTRGKERTVFQLPPSLLPLLKKWQEQQKEMLRQINIRTSSTHLYLPIQIVKMK